MVTIPTELAADLTTRGCNWWSLLPRLPGEGFRRLLLLGASEALAARVRALGLAREVTDRLPPGGRADAVVALSGTCLSASDIRSALAPGGVLYWEVDRRTPGLAAATQPLVARALRRAGLAPTGAYLVRPNWTDSAVYVPLGTPGALRWYVRCVYLATTPRRRLRAGVLRELATPLARVLPHALRAYAITAAVPDGCLPSVALLGIPELPDILRRPDLRPALLTLGGSPLRRQIVLAFATAGNRPLAVLKVSRIPAGNSAVDAEHAALCGVRAALPPHLREDLPEPLGLTRAGPRAVSIESYVPGVPLSIEFRRWRAWRSRLPVGLREAARWLTDFHRATVVRHLQWDETALSHWVDTPLTACLRSFGTGTEVGRLVSTTRRRSRLLVGTPLPIVWQHGSFDPPNVVRDRGRHRVIDWEHAAPGLPLLDLIHFAWRWACTLQACQGPEPQAKLFRELYWDPRPANALAEEVRFVLLEYMAALRLDRRFLPVAVVLTSVTDGLRAFHRSTAAHRAGPAQIEMPPYLSAIQSSLRSLGHDAGGGIWSP